MEALYKIQPKYWALLVFRKHGFTYREIAFMRGDDPGNTHGHMTRAILLLTQIINTGRRG